ncbi:VTC domain-containing protein [Globomyces pollinis-pini]|nr:VTC domain-containing protein [Globomyces pollinis-pini]KAJ2996062.1 vacuolar transporter chaperone [Globomyces sp. JEL0801]
MKFGTQLSNALHPEWKFYYVDYDELKRLLKARGEKFSEINETSFVESLESELDKVSSFCTIKSDELLRRVQHCETSVDAILAASKGTDIDLSQFDRVSEEIGHITAEVSELSKFIRLNYSAFLKILKKHDKHTSYMLKNMFMIRLQSKPFYKLSFDALILRLSKLYDTVRTGGKREVTGPPAGSSQSYVRKTTKYWVHPDNVTEVKIHILKHLPVLNFSKSGKPDDPAITSIYFDNDAFELYTGRLEKSQGAEAHRIRWYGNMDQTEIFIERKTHQEDWTGESSVKVRFSIKEKYVNDFIAGKYTMDRTIEKMRERKAKSDKELDDTLQLSREIQETMLKKELHPVVRTFYNRTAFQLPGDARVRISLDTELTMIREDNYGVPRSGNNWRRLDAGTIAPFTHLPEEDVEAFPYAVLEVKLQTQHGTTPPQWVQDLINSHLVEEVPKFSKFIHGCATLLESRVGLLPFWLPQMDKDIRKPAPANNPISASKPSSTTFIESRPPKNKQPLVDEIQVDVDEDDDNHDETTPLIGSSKQTTKKVKTHGGRNAGIPSTMNNKKIVIPVRVEPKVFFANERTFLSWLHFCIVLGGLALGLLNFGDTVGQISGLVFTVVAMMFMIYALFLYQWRAEKIRNRDPGPYDDRVGPTILVISLFFAIVANFYLKFSSNSR